MVPAPSQQICKPSRSVALDVNVLLAGLSQALPSRKSFLLTPFVETVLLIERLSVAGVPIKVMWRVSHKHDQGHTLAHAIEHRGWVFNARSLDPWGDIEQWHARQSDRPLTWMDHDPLTPEEVAQAMRNAEPAYAPYRGQVDAVIERACAHGQAQTLETSTIQAAGQGSKTRL